MNKGYRILSILLMAMLVTSACSTQPATVTIEPAVDTAEAANGETPSEPQEVTGPGEYGNVAVFEIIHRSENKKVADVCGNHWHGMLPFLEAGDSVSLGAHVVDEFGEEILLMGSGYTLEAAVDEGSPEEIISFDFHGDHLYLIGEEEGETRVVFHLLLDGEVVYQTPSLAVYVD